MRLSTLDLIATIMDRPARPLDWAIVLHLRNGPSVEMLREGAESARLSYPSSAALLDGHTWKAISSRIPLEQRVIAATALRETIHGFVDNRMDITQTPPLAQGLLSVPGSDERVALVTRVHH